MAYSARLTSITQDKIVPKVIDTVLNSNVFAMKLLRSAKAWSGETFKIPLKYQNGTSGASFNGFDTFSTNASERRVSLSFTPKFYEKSVVLPLDEVDINGVDETKVLDLVAIEMSLAAQEMADELGTIFWSDGTGNSSKDFLGLTAHVDDGNTVSTIGGLSRSTYATLASTKTASGGSLSLAKMRTLYNAITSGMQKPTIGYATEAVFGFYEQLLQPMLRINVDALRARSASAFRGEGGFSGLDFQGFAIVPDEKCTSQNLYFLNEDFLEWKALPSKMNKPVPYSPQDIEGNDYSEVAGLGFSWSGWIRPSNSYSIIGHIILGGEFVGSNPKRHGRLTGITGV